MKSYALFLTELAQKDIYDSEKFYEDQSPNLGVYFYDSIIVDLDALKSMQAFIKNILDFTE